MTRFECALARFFTTPRRKDEPELINELSSASSTENEQKLAEVPRIVQLLERTLSPSITFEASILNETFIIHERSCIFYRQRIG